MALKIEQEHISWLDNSFISAVVKSTDMSHSGKRSHCSALLNGKRKTAKLQCITQKDCVNNVSVDSAKQVCNVKCNDKVSMNMKGKISSPDADKNRKMEAIQRHPPTCVSPISSAVDDNDEVHLFTRKDQSAASLVFTGCHFY